MAHNEQIFTPQYIVEDILDRVGYYIIGNNTSNIRKKHIIDNSCGNGAFLKVIVERYIDACKIDKLSIEETIKEIETYIHGIEIDSTLSTKTIIELQRICNNKGLETYSHINFDITCQDAMTCDYYDGQMDYVVGNPPYCRVHDLKEKYNIVKEFNFAQGGMTDLYLVFFEIGINMLNEKGKLGYITPNSWMTSKAGHNFRKWLKETNHLTQIVQLGDKKIFENATTFTNITVIDKAKNDNLFRYSFDINDMPLDGNLNVSFIDDKFYIGNDATLELLKEISDSSSTHNKIKVKNGFATLNDKLFIMNVDCGIIHKTDIFKKNLIPIWKASKNKVTTAIYPYNENGKPLKYEEINENTRHTLEIASKTLEVDTTDENWYLYGRYQGIKDMSKYRIGINTIICDNITSIKVKLLEPYVGIYSGLYIVCENDEYFIEENYKKLYDLLVNLEFINYVKSLGKYKNGGYYTFSSKDLENYLNFKIN